MNLTQCTRTLGAVALYTVLATFAVGNPSSNQVSAPSIPYHNTNAPVPNARRLASDRWIDTSNRETVRNFYRAVFSASDGYNSQWTGNYETRNPVTGAGTTDLNFRKATILRVNFYRALAGVPAWIELDDRSHRDTQLTALAISQHGSVPHDHRIDSSWSHYTRNAASTAMKSNLSIGSCGPEAIDSYMEDGGSANDRAGHRRWILYPQTRRMSTGDVPGNGITYGQAGYKGASNSLIIYDENLKARRPDTRDGYVAFPPKGYIPHTIVFPRWSFSFPDADFSRATVRMSSEGRNIATRIEHAARPGRSMTGENTLVWVPTGLGIDPDNFTLWEAPTHDTVYTVTIDKVSIRGRYESFTYDVIIFDPTTSEPNNTLATLKGDPRGTLHQSNTYALDTISGADNYTWRAITTRLLDFNQGGEQGLTAFYTELSTQKDRRQPANTGISRDIWKNGGSAFHLAMPVAKDQSLTIKSLLVPQKGASLQFASRLTWASPNQVAMVQVSTDDGKYWDSIWMRQGTDDRGQTFFQNIAINLDAYAGRTILVRFTYAYLGGRFFPQSKTSIGWYFDNVRLNNCDTIDSVLAAGLTTADRFNYAPTIAGNFYLQACPMIFDEFGLEWGPLFAASSSIPGLEDEADILASNDTAKPAIAGLDPEHFPAIARRTELMAQ